MVAGHDDLAERGHNLSSSGAGEASFDRDFAPRQHREALSAGQRLELPAHLVGRSLFDGEERHPCGVGPKRRKFYVEHGPEEPVRDLDEHTGAVPCLGVSSLAPRCSRWHRLVKPISTMA